VQSRPGARPDLAAKLSVTDLARVRQALAILSEDHVTDSSQSGGVPGGSVPSVIGARPQATGITATGDDVDTFPLPVILPKVAASPPPEPIEAPRGPFEPARPGQPATGPADAALGEPAPASPARDEPGAPGKVREMPPGAEEKLDQIKDLLFMAEAIGEQNLDRHFDQVSQRQRELIREFFDRAVPGDDRGA